MSSLPHRSTVPLRYVICQKREDKWECDIYHSCNKKLLEKMDQADRVFQIPFFYPKWMVHCSCLWNLSPIIKLK